MSQFTREQVDKVALLSRLSFTDEEATAFAGQLSAILEHVDELNKLDVSNIEPTSHSLPLLNVLRADEPRASLTNDEALANAPDQAAGCFKVPAIIQEQ